MVNPAVVEVLEPDTGCIVVKQEASIGPQLSL
jgi:hypothetical protein